jgi:hypothetical protein
MKKFLASLTFAVSAFFLIMSVLGIIFTYEAHRLGQLHGVPFHSFALRTEVLMAGTVLFFWCGKKMWPKRVG